jgi:HD-like signal output (HDOD) protein
VHDIGKVVIALAAPERYARVLDETERTGRPAHFVEHSVLGTTHAEIGGYLLGVWGLPSDLVETALFHHAPRQCGAADSSVLAAVHVADAFVDSTCGGDPTAAPKDQLDTEFLSRDELASELPCWMRIANELRAPKSALPSTPSANSPAALLGSDSIISQGTAKH